MKNTFKKSGSSNFFSEDFRLRKLSSQGDPLEKLNKVIDWEFFRNTVEKTLRTDKLTNAGPKPYDPLLLFKILILQRYYNLGDAQIEFQILDRLTFCRFLGLSLNDRVPDEKTIWVFKEKISSLNIDNELFDLFSEVLNENGLIAQEGKIIDASFVEAPKQRNSREENAQIKNGSIPTEWNDKPNKKRQKDVDAKWTKKNNEAHYGYKNHIKVDNKHKLIDTCVATDASVHDSQALETLLRESDKDQELYADCAYVGLKDIIENEFNMINKVHERGYKTKPLTEEQKKNNKNKSKTRVRVEHVFGFMEHNMNKLNIRTIGIRRAKQFVNMVNLTYNLFRYEQITRINKISMPNW